MDFNFSIQENEFRLKVRNLFQQEEFVQEIRQLSLGDKDTDPRQLYKLMGKEGLLAPNFPEEFGGQDKSMLEAAIAIEEMMEAKIPDTLHLVSVQIVGALLLTSASETQKENYLLPLGKGEKFGCVLYTEPSAGSDLGSLATEAVPTNDGGYKIYGTKIFNLKTNLLDFAVCAAKVRGYSNSSYDSITLFIIPLKDANVEIEKLNSMADENFYKISLNGVYVTADSIIGDVGSGWSTITKALALERTGHDYYIKAQKSFNAFKQYIEETNLLNINDYATELNKLSSKLEVAKLMSYRVLKQIDNMKIDEEKAAISKWYASELACEITNKAVEIIGVSSYTKSMDKNIELLEAAYRECPGNTISAGSSEMMLETVARLVLLKD